MDNISSALFESTIPECLREAVEFAYRCLFEDADGGMDTTGAREPAMQEHGTVGQVGPGKHTITMGPNKVGYDIDGTHVGWANPGGKYDNAPDAQDAFDKAYLDLISRICPKLSADDRKACAMVMGDFDGLWYYTYDNGTGRTNGLHASDEVRRLGASIGIDNDDRIDELSNAIERIAIKYAKQKGVDIPSDEIAKWFDEHGVKITKDQLSEVMKVIRDKTKFYTDEADRIAKIEDETGTENLREMIVTNKNLPNRPQSEEIWKNIAYMAKHLKALRDATGLNIHVNSCFRSPAVNAAVNGSDHSAHLKGLAMDLSAGNEQDNRAMYKALTDRILPWDIDQLIMYNDTPHSKNTPIRFIHVGMNPSGGRHQRLFS